MVDIVKFLPLLDLREKRLEDLSLGDLSKIAIVAGVKINITEELKDAGLALLRGENIDTVADMIKSPDSIRQVVQFLQNRSDEDVMAEQEIGMLYSGNIFGEPDFVPDLDTPQVRSVAQDQTPASVLISSPLVGWRLPG